MQKSFDEINHILDLMGIPGSVPVLHGSENSMVDEKTPVDSEGARFIIEEANKDDDRPLFIMGLGQFTTVASALLMDPSIEDKFTVVMTCGCAYPEGGWEHNMSNDIASANVLFKSNVNLWQLTYPVYSSLRVSFAELYQKVYPCGELGKYLVDYLTEVCYRMSIPEGQEGLIPDENVIQTMMMNFKAVPTMAEIATQGGTEIWPLCDLSVVGVMMQNQIGDFDIVPAPTINEDSTYNIDPDNDRMIRVYKDVNVRMILEDMFAKFQYLKD